MKTQPNTKKDNDQIDQASEGRGPHAGRGPRNYRRSDERITEEINERLTLNSVIDPSDVEVNVKEGEVILEGTVEDRRTKRKIENIADAVSGVKDVHNRLRLQSGEQDREEDIEQYKYPNRLPEDSGPAYRADEAAGYDPWLEVYQDPASFSEYRSDPSGPYRGRGPKGYKPSPERTADRINNRLTEDGQLNAENIEVEVNADQIILSGSVNSYKERQIADGIASSVAGDAQVINQLKVK